MKFLANATMMQIRNAILGFEYREDEPKSIKVKMIDPYNGDCDFSSMTQDLYAVIEIDGETRYMLYTWDINDEEITTAHNIEQDSEDDEMDDKIDLIQYNDGKVI